MRRFGASLRRPRVAPGLSFLWDSLPRRACPTLVLRGGRSRVLAARWSVGFERTIRGFPCNGEGVPAAHDASAR